MLWRELGKANHLSESFLLFLYSGPDSPYDRFLMRVRYQLFSLLLVFSLASASLAGSGAMSPKPEVQTIPLHTDGKLREQLKTLTEALNKRDLETIRAQ